MARAQGFARGDFDTSFPIDDKFLALRVAVDPTRYYAASGVYWHVAAAAWREVERKPASRICPDAGVQIADLMAVGLLDSDERLPNRAFLAYVGRAKRQRAKTSDRQRQHREGMSRVSHRTSRVTERDKQLVTGGHNPARVQGHVVTGEDGSTGGSGGDTLTAAVDYVETRTGRPWQHRPGSKVWDTLTADLRDFGPAPVLAAMAAVPGDHLDHGQLIFGASNRLHPIDRPANGTKSKGSGPTAEEAERAFR